MQKRLVYISDVFMAKTSATATGYVLALATLGEATKIETILYLLSCHPRWPRQVRRVRYCRWYCAKLCQCKQGFKAHIHCQYMYPIMPPILQHDITFFTSLGSMTQIEWFLFMSHHPRGPRHVQWWLTCFNFASIIVGISALSFANVNMALRLIYIGNICTQ